MPQHSISIPQPCHQDWDAMTPTQRGRHCAACQKVVIDFTLMTDAQILDVFKQAKDHPPCGSFLNTQLDRPLIDNRYKPSFISMGAKRAAAVVLLLQAASATIWAQQAKITAHTTQHSSKNKAKTRQLRHLKIWVLNAEDHRPAAGATVHIKNYPLTAVTDSTGAITLALPDTLLTLHVALQYDAQAVTESTVDLTNNAAGDITLYISKKQPDVDIIQFTRMQGGAQITDITSVSPQLYSTRGGPILNTDGARSSSNLYIIDGINPDKPTFWQLITKPFRGKKASINERK